MGEGAQGGRGEGLFCVLMAKTLLFLITVMVLASTFS